MLGSPLSTSHMLNPSISKACCGSYYFYLYFAGGETEAQPGTRHGLEQAGPGAFFPHSYAVLIVLGGLFPLPVLSKWYNYDFARDVVELM